MSDRFQRPAHQGMCPCGGGLYATCCGRFHAGTAHASTAEELMRSRYSAYATGLIDYIEATLDPDERAHFDRAAAELWATSATFTGLAIDATTRGGPRDNRGTVTFRASWLAADGAHERREKSLFLKKAGRWYYVRALN